MKTNKELNQEYDKKQQERVRPKQSAYDFKPLEEVVNNWIRNSLNREQT
jgi:predicted RNA-binding protein with RPS1 domain